MTASATSFDSCSSASVASKISLIASSNPFDGLDSLSGVVSEEQYDELEPDLNS